jgi:hypothetical protein
MTAAIDEQVVEQVRNFWAENPHWSARAVAREYLRRYGDSKIKERKIIEIVSTAKKAAPKEPFPFAEWKAWVDPQETPEESYFLLLLNYIKQAESGASLCQHEARWARWLRGDVAGLNPYSQYKLVSLYAMREVINYYLNRPQYNDDLDGFITFRPWRPHHNWAAYYIYVLALELGVVPFPEVDPRKDPRQGQSVIIDPTTMPGLQIPEGPGSMPGLQVPEGPGPAQDSDVAERLRNGLLWLLTPPEELAPDRESDPQKRQSLELLLKLWTLELETSQSVQYHHQVQQLLALLVGQYVNEQEQPREEQPVGD